MPNYSPLAAGFPQPTSLFVVQANGIGATIPSTLVPVSGIYLVNKSKADNVGVQLSPPIIWEGQGLNTTANSAQTIVFRAYVQPVNAATNPTANWLLQSSINGAAYTTAMTVTTGGALTISGVISASQLTTAVSGGTWVIGNNGVVSVSGNGGTNKVSITGGNAQLNVGTDNIANQINGSGTFAVNKNATQYFLITNAGLVGIGASTPTALLNLFSPALGTTFTTASGAYLQNTTAAAAGAQQISPPLIWEGQGWGTTTPATAAVAFAAHVLPVQGTTSPSGQWLLKASIAGGAFSTVLSVTSASVISNSSGGQVTIQANGVQILTSGSATGGISLNGSSAVGNSIIITSGFILNDSNGNTGAGTNRIGVTGASLGTTSGNQQQFIVYGTFAPASGTAAFNNIYSGPTINQTGGANGITRGLYVGPTLTAAADWRGLQVDNSQTTIATPILINRTSAVLNTTPKDGAIEVDASHIYHVISSTRYQLDQQVPAALSSGQTTLVAGTVAVSVTNVTTSSKAVVTLVTPSGTSLTTHYQAVCTTGTVTIQANVAAGTINSSDISVVNYIVIF